MESLYPMLPPKEVNQMNMLALAHVGDAVYELLVRSMLCREKKTGVMQAPHHAGIAQYHAATGLEALFGWLYLQGRNERIGELFTIIMEE